MDLTPLVERSKSGDTEAYGRLVERYQDYVFAICMAYLRQRDLAEDATQEIFLASFQSVRKLQEANRFQAWLKRMAINHCLDELRRKRRFLVSSIDEVHEKDMLRSAQLRAGGRQFHETGTHGLYRSVSFEIAGEESPYLAPPLRPGYSVDRGDALHIGRRRKETIGAGQKGLERGDDQNGCQACDRQRILQKNRRPDQPSGSRQYAGESCV